MSGHIVGYSYVHYDSTEGYVYTGELTQIRNVRNRIIYTRKRCMDQD